MSPVVVDDKENEFSDALMGILNPNFVVKQIKYFQKENPAFNFTQHIFNNHANKTFNYDVLKEPFRDNEK
jgi:hypothetical protein